MRCQFVHVFVCCLQVVQQDMVQTSWQEQQVRLSLLSLYLHLAVTIEILLVVLNVKLYNDIDLYTDFI